MSIEILDCLKRKRDICVKAIITSQNTAFMLTPALSYNFECDWLIEMSDNKLSTNKLSDNNLASELVENRSFLN